MSKKQQRPDYYSDPRISNSGLKLFSEYSPRVAFHKLKNGIKETDALIFGRFLHSSVLEPDTIDKEYYLLPEDFSLRSKANKELYQEIKDSGKTPIKWDMQQQANKMVNRIFESKNARTLLKGIPEKEYFAEVDNIAFKSKLDLINPDKGYILDLKTTLNPEPEAFIKEAFNRLYFMQAHCYRLMASLNGENIKKFFFLNIAKDESMGLSIVEVSEEQFAIGEQQFIHAMALYKYALKNKDKDWDTYPMGCKSFVYDTPAWMSRKVLGEEE